VRRICFKTTPHKEQTVKLSTLVLTLAFVGALGGAAVADSMGTPHPSPSPSSHMSSSHMGSLHMMKASPKPSPMHSSGTMSHGTTMDHGSMMKASPKPSMSP
jgi:hypothetical protein